MNLTVKRIAVLLSGVILGIWLLFWLAPAAAAGEGEETFLPLWCEICSQEPGDDLRLQWINLEQWPGMDAHKAGKIRAIFDAVRLGAAPEDLEALQSEKKKTAAVLAIRMLMGQMCPCMEELQGELSEWVAYFSALAPKVNEGVMVSDEAIHIHRVQQEAGRVVVGFATDVDLHPGDSLMVWVFCAEQSIGFPLTQENREQEHKVVFSDVSGIGEIRVEIRGYQRVEGVFLGCGSRGEGMLGYLSGARTVHGEAIAAVPGERVLAIHGALAGEGFQVYRVGTLGEWLAGDLVLNPQPEGEELAMYKTAERYCTTIVTDTRGEGSCNFTAAALEDGIYLVVGKWGSAPEYVMMPAMDAQGNLGNGLVHFCPKNREGQKNTALRNPEGGRGGFSQKP